MATEEDIPRDPLMDIDQPENEEDHEVEMNEQACAGHTPGRQQRRRRNVNFEDDREAEPSNANTNNNQPEDEDEENNIKCLVDRGLTPGQHGYIRQPKGIKARGAILSVRVKGTLQPLPAALFTPEVVEAVVHQNTSKVRTSLSRSLKFSPINILLEGTSTSIVRLCDAVMEPAQWLGVPVVMTALIISAEDVNTICAKLQATADNQVQQMEVSPVKATPTQALQAMVNTQKFQRKPRDVQRAAQLTGTNPGGAQCTMCGGFGHVTNACPTNQLLNRNLSAQTLMSTGSANSLVPRDLSGKPPKLPSFSGDATKDNVSFAQWVYQVKAHARNYNESKMREALVIALKGTAADMVRLMGEESSVENILQRLSVIYGTVGSYESMMQEFYDLSQKHGEDVASFASRVQTMAGTISEHFPRRLPREDLREAIREKFYVGLREPLKSTLRYKFDSPMVTYEELLQLARKVESERPSKPKNVEARDKVAQPQKKGGLLSLVRNHSTALSLPEGEGGLDPQPESEPVEEEFVDRQSLRQLIEEVVEMKRAAFTSQDANGPARPATSDLRATAPAFKPKKFKQDSGTSDRPSSSQGPKNMSKEEIDRMLQIVCHKCMGRGHMARECPTQVWVTLNGNKGASTGGWLPAESKPKAS